MSMTLNGLSSLKLELSSLKLRIAGFTSSTLHNLHRFARFSMMKKHLSEAE